VLAFCFNEISFQLLKNKNIIIIFFLSGYLNSRMFYFYLSK